MKCAQRDCNQPARARSNYCAVHEVTLAMQERYTAAVPAHDHSLSSMPPVSAAMPDALPSYSRGSRPGRIVFWVAAGIIAIVALVPAFREALLHLLRIGR